MKEDEGTYSQLVEVDQEKATRAARAIPSPIPVPTQPPKTASPPLPEAPTEDINTTPHLSQNYRFTDQELHWLRKQSYDLTERFGTKVSQNAVLRIALHSLRQAAEKNQKENPLLEAASQIKK